MYKRERELKRWNYCYYYISLCICVYQKKRKKEKYDSLDRPTGQSNNERLHNFHPTTATLDSSSSNLFLMALATAAAVGRKRELEKKIAYHTRKAMQQRPRL